MNGSNMYGSKMNGSKMNGYNMNGSKMNRPNMNGSNVNVSNKNVPFMNGSKMNGSYMNRSKWMGHYECLQEYLDFSKNKISQQVNVTKTTISICQHKAFVVISLVILVDESLYCRS